MGLDAVEIVMKVEETFGITIPDTEAEKIITVGDFHSCVWKHLDAMAVGKCKSQAIFYKLRQAAIDIFSINREDFLPAADPNLVFPADGRRALYFRLSQETAMKFPKLQLPVTWSIFLFLFWVITSSAALLLLYNLTESYHLSRWLLSLALLLLVPTFLLSRLLEPQRTVIEQRTLRAFVEQVLMLNYASISNEPTHNRREVESIINYIIADQAGLDLAEVTPDKRIVADLGIQ